MNTKKFSLLIAGLIWVWVGIRIGNRAIDWLEPYYNPPNWQLVFILVSLALGYLKATTILKKSVNRSLGNTDKLDDHFSNYIIGWLKLFGVRGTIVISLMIGKIWALFGLIPEFSSFRRLL